MNEQLIKELISAMRDYTQAVSQLAVSVSMLVESMGDEQPETEQSTYLDGSPRI